MSQRRLRTELRVPPSGLFGQRSQLRLALDNLVTNAIKHAPDGSVIEIAIATPDNHCELAVRDRSEEHTSELQSLMRISYAVFCLKKKTNRTSIEDIPQEKKHTHEITEQKCTKTTVLCSNKNKQ